MGQNEITDGKELCEAAGENIGYSLTTLSLPPVNPEEAGSVENIATVDKEMDDAGNIIAVTTGLMSSSTVSFSTIRANPGRAPLEGSSALEFAGHRKGLAEAPQVPGPFLLGLAEAPRDPGHQPAQSLPPDDLAQLLPELELPVVEAVEEHLGLVDKLSRKLPGNVLHVPQHTGDEVEADPAVGGVVHILLGQVQLLHLHPQVADLGLRLVPHLAGDDVLGAVHQLHLVGLKLSLLLVEVGVLVEDLPRQLPDVLVDRELNAARSDVVPPDQQRGEGRGEYLM